MFYVIHKSHEIAPEARPWPFFLESRWLYQSKSDNPQLFFIVFPSLHLHRFYFSCSCLLLSISIHFRLPLLSHAPPSRISQTYCTMQGCKTYHTLIRGFGSKPPTAHEDKLSHRLATLAEKPAATNPWPHYLVFTHLVHGCSFSNGTVALTTQTYPFCKVR